MPLPTPTYPADPTGGAGASADTIKWEDTAMLYRAFRDLVVEANLPPTLRGGPWTDYQKKKFNADNFTKRYVEAVWQTFDGGSSYAAFLQNPGGAGSLFDDLNAAEKEVLGEGHLHIRLQRQPESSVNACFCCSVMKLAGNTMTLVPGNPSDCQNNSFSPGGPTEAISDTTLFNCEFLSRAVVGELSLFAFVAAVGGSMEPGTGHTGFYDTPAQPCQKYQVTYDVVMSGDELTYTVTKIVRPNLYAEFCWPIRAAYYQDIMRMLRLAGATRSITTDWFAPGSSLYLIKAKHAATASMIFWKAKEVYPSVGITYGPAISEAGCFNIQAPLASAPVDGPLGKDCKARYCTEEDDTVLVTCSGSGEAIPSSFAQIVNNPIAPASSCSDVNTRVYAKTLRQLGACLKILQDHTDSSSFTHIAVPVGGQLSPCICCDNDRILFKAITTNPDDANSINYRRQDAEGDWVVGGSITGDSPFLGMMVNLPTYADGNWTCALTPVEVGSWFYKTGYFGLSEVDCYTVYPYMDIVSNPMHGELFTVFDAIYGEKIVVNDPDCLGCRCGGGHCEPSAEVVCASSGGEQTASGITIDLVSEFACRYAEQRVLRVSSTTTQAYDSGVVGSSDCWEKRSGSQNYTLVTTYDVDGNVTSSVAGGSCESFSESRCLFWSGVLVETWDNITSTRNAAGVDTGTRSYGRKSTPADPGDYSYSVPYSSGCPYEGDAPTVTSVTEYQTYSPPVQLRITGSGMPNTSKTFRLVFKETCAGDPAPPPNYISQDLTLSYDSSGQAAEQFIEIPQPSSGCVATCLECTVSDNHSGDSCACITFSGPCAPSNPQTFTYVTKIYGLPNTSYTAEVCISNNANFPPIQTTQIVSATTNDDGEVTIGPFSTPGCDMSICGVTLLP